MANEIALAQSDFSLNEEHRTLVVQNLTELRDSVWETMSLNTRKAYQSDFNQYLKFRQTNTRSGLHPIDPFWNAGQKLSSLASRYD